jgi:hypothetical protein
VTQASRRVIPDAKSAVRAKADVRQSSATRRIVTRNRQSAGNVLVSA